MSPPSHSGNRSGEIDPPEGPDYDELASNVRYECSDYHKSYKTASRPKASRTSLCPDEFKGKSDLLTTWVAEAIRTRAVSGNFRGDYPSVIWYKADDGTVYKGRITNQTQGVYHGFPISEDEWPQNIEEYYD